VSRRAFLTSIVSLPFGQDIAGATPVEMRSCVGAFTMTINEIRHWYAPEGGPPLTFFEALDIAARHRLRKLSFERAFGKRAG
jgi:hypothetical protein